MKIANRLAAIASLYAALLAPAGAAGPPLILPVPEAMEAAMLRISATSRCSEECVVRNAPYAAERRFTSEQQLADGNRISSERIERIYRDGKGRTRVESEWLGRPLVQIQDPVAGVSYRLYPHNRSGLMMRISPPQAAPGAPPSAPGPATGPAASAGAAKVAQQLGAAMHAGASDTLSERHSKPLGSKIMEGITVEGILQTSTLPARAAGNTLPLLHSQESWHAPELNIALYTRSVDPRTGERSMRVTALTRQEPAAALFAPPRGYLLRDVWRVR